MGHEECPDSPVGAMNNGGPAKPQQQRQQQHQGEQRQYLDELHPAPPHARFAKNVYIELAAFSDSIYERGKEGRKDGRTASVYLSSSPNSVDFCSKSLVVL